MKKNEIEIYAEPISMILSLILFAGVITLLVSRIGLVLDLTFGILILILMGLTLILYAFSISYGTKTKNKERLK